MLSSEKTPSERRREQIASWYLHRAHRAMWNLPLTGGLLFLIGMILLRGTAEDPEANLVRSRAELLALAPPSIPNTENAATDYATAQALKVGYVRPQNAPASLESPANSIFKSSECYDDPSFRAIYAANAGAIAAILQGASKERCNFGLNYLPGLSMNMPQLGQMRDNARMLAGSARLSAHLGDHATAAKNIAAIYKMVPHVESDPMLISGLVGIAMCAIADGAVESILAWDMPTKVEEVAAYRKAVWQKRDPAGRFVKVMHGEKTIGLYTIDCMFSGRLNPAAVTAMGLANIPGGPVWYGSERKCYVSVMDELVNDPLQTPQRTRDFRAIIERHQVGPAILAGLLIPVLDRAKSSFCASEEQARVTDVGLAVLQFRLARGRDPKTLDELVPEFLQALPHGVFADVPLILRVDSEGVIEQDGKGVATVRDSGTLRVYAFGPNGQDDKGYKKDLARFYSEGVDDTVFCIPPMTRTPPKPMEAGKKK
ncbi:MAG TPA: hypothetical protein VGP72_30255 [Planctomycetota bacterium]